MSQNQTKILLASQVDELERLYPGDIVKGYLDGTSGAPWPDEEVSPAYEHGRRNGVNDRHGTVDPEQRLLAADILQRERFKAVMADLRKRSLPKAETPQAAPGARQRE